MKKIFLMLAFLSFCILSNAQSWTPIQGKQRFLKGIGIPVSDTLQGSIADSAQFILRPQDSTIYYKYKGYWKPVESVSSVFGRTGSIIANVGDYSLYYYPLTGNPSNYLTASALTSYLTISSAASTYYPLTNPNGFITNSALLPYATQTALNDTATVLRSLIIASITDTTSLSNRIASNTNNIAALNIGKLNVADTTNKWLPIGTVIPPPIDTLPLHNGIVANANSIEALVADSVYQATQIAGLTTTAAGKVNISDTAAMLANYRSGIQLLASDTVYQASQIASLVSDSVYQASQIAALQANKPWSLIGNTGTSPTTNFLGTTDYNALAIRTNNLQRVIVDTSGNVGINTTTPTEKLDVTGNTNVGGTSTNQTFRIANLTGSSGTLQDITWNITNYTGAIGSSFELYSTGINPDSFHWDYYDSLGNSPASGDFTLTSANSPNIPIPITLGLTVSFAHTTGHAGNEDLFMTLASVTTTVDPQYKLLGQHFASKNGSIIDIGRGTNQLPTIQIDDSKKIVTIPNGNLNLTTPLQVGGNPGSYGSVLTSGGNSSTAAPFWSDGFLLRYARGNVNNPNLTYDVNSWVSNTSGNILASSDNFTGQTNLTNLPIGTTPTKVATSIIVHGQLTPSYTQLYWDANTLLVRGAATGGATTQQWLKAPIFNAINQFNIVAASTTADADLTLMKTGAFGLAFGTNNVERGRFNATGNFGIGNTNPTARLVVDNGGSTTLSALKLKYPFSGTTTDSVLTWNPTDSTIRLIASSRLGGGSTTVSNTSTSNSLSTTVNGVTGASVAIINSNTLTSSAGTITNTTNGVSTGAVALAGITTSNLSPTAGITNTQLANSTISGIALGGNLSSLTNGYGVKSFSYNGSTATSVITDTAFIIPYTDTLKAGGIATQTYVNNATTAALAQKLNISDTAAMLANYRSGIQLLSSDTVFQASQIASLISDSLYQSGKINSLISDSVYQASQIAALQANKPWSITGNTGTNNNTNFIGATDVPVNVVGNVGVSIYGRGSLGYTPTAKFLGAPETGYQIAIGNGSPGGTDGVVICEGSATGYVATTIGGGSNAGAYSVSLSKGIVNGGTGGTAISGGTTSGDWSVATCHGYSPSQGEFSTGVVTNYTVASSSGDVASDRTFSVGSGLHSLSNVITALKGGQVGFSNDHPTATIHTMAQGTVPALKIGIPFSGALTDSLLTWDAADSSVRKIPTSAISGVTSFNARTGAVVPLVGDYSSFYTPITKYILDSTANAAALAALVADSVYQASQIAALQANKPWSLTGNAGTDSTKNFIGTTDDVPLVFKVRNNQSGIIDRYSANTSLGFLTLQSNVTGTGGGYNNTAFGAYGLSSNTTAFSNTAIGAYAQYLTTTGGSNTAVGNYALLSNTTGSFNTAIGFSALYSNTTGTGSTAVGNAALANSTGYPNDAFGNAALVNNTIGQNNVALGYTALFSNTTGAANISIGHGSMLSNTTGSGNIALGLSTLSLNNGGSNIAIGNGTLGSLTNGNNNIAIGDSAGRYANSSNELFINNQDLGSYNNDTTQSIVYGKMTGNIATQRLKINGRLQVNDGTQAAGSVLISDANGVASWKPSSSVGAVSSVFGRTGAVVSNASDYSGIYQPFGNYVLQSTFTSDSTIFTNNIATNTNSINAIKSINGILKSNGTTVSAAVAGTDYLTPTGSAASLTNFPTFNQNTTGTASTITGTVTQSNVTTSTFLAPTFQIFTSGSGTYTLPTSPRKPLYLEIKQVGGGGGGAGSGTSGTGATAGGNGGNTTFGSSLLVANGGTGGNITTFPNSGGTASLGTASGVAFSGATGVGGTTSAGSAIVGGSGGSSAFGGAGGGGRGSGAPAAPNSGSGGGGGGGAVFGVIGGNGGGSGGYNEAYISNPLSSYSYSVGTGGSVGAAGGNGAVGGAGASGIIIVKEYYQ